MTNVIGIDFDATPPVEITDTDLLPLGRLYAALLPLEAQGPQHHVEGPDRAWQIMFRSVPGERTDKVMHRKDQDYVNVAGCTECRVATAVVMREDENGRPCFDVGQEPFLRFQVFYLRHPDDSIETVALNVWERGDWEADVLNAYDCEDFNPFESDVTP